jgi:hypothetical protein
MTKNKVQEYLKYEYHTKYPLEENGYWIIYGEDPNCDFGGSHHEPLLEIVSGKYIDVVTYATTLKSFYTWGSGGRIVKTTITDIDETINVEKLKLLQEKEELQQKLQEIQAKLSMVK